MQRAGLSVHNHTKAGVALGQEFILDTSKRLFEIERAAVGRAQPANREPGIQPAVPKSVDFRGSRLAARARNDNLSATWYQFSSLKYFALTLRD